MDRHSRISIIGQRLNHSWIIVRVVNILLFLATVQIHFPSSRAAACSEFSSGRAYLLLLLLLDPIPRRRRSFVNKTLVRKSSIQITWLRVSTNAKPLRSALSQVQSPCGIWAATTQTSCFLYEKPTGVFAAHIAFNYNSQVGRGIPTRCAGWLCCCCCWFSADKVLSGIRSGLLKNWQWASLFRAPRYRANGGQLKWVFARTTWIGFREQANPQIWAVTGLSGHWVELFLQIKWLMGGRGMMNQRYRRGTIEIRI